MFSEAEIEAYEKYSRHDSAIEKLSEAIGPMIFGLDYVKQGILFSLASLDDDYERNRIHTLIIGEPGTAKSKLVRWAANFFRCPFLTHRTTDVGFTGTVSSPGVLSKYPIVCVDEMDKICTANRNGILEAMSDGVITVTTGGDSVTYEAQVRIIACCNDASVFTPEQLDRFDFVYYLKKPDKEMLKKIFRHKLLFRKEEPKPPYWLKRFLDYIQEREIDPLADIDSIIQLIDEHIDTAENPTPRRIDNILRVAKVISSIRGRPICDNYIIKAIHYIPDRQYEQWLS